MGSDGGVTELPDLSLLSHAEKDVLIRAAYSDEAGHAFRFEAGHLSVVWLGHLLMIILSFSGVKRAW
jgi:hypothetical protein